MKRTAFLRKTPMVARTEGKPRKCRHCKVRLELVGAVIHEQGESE